MNFEIVPVKTEQQIQAVVDLAIIIWRDHYVPINGQAHVDYMLEKFQSCSAIRRQLNDGYEYFQIQQGGKLIGYIGVQEDNNSLFLSKLYVSSNMRGHGTSRKAFEFLQNLCAKRSLKRIWLTCNKYNENTLAVYKHFGFQIIDSCETDIGRGYIMDDYILEYII